MAAHRERPLCLMDLHDKVVHIFGFLPLEQRLGSVELVCRRFRDLSWDAPQLHLTAVVLQSHFLSALVRVRSLAEWLIKRGGSVQRLNMQLGVNLRSEGSTAEGDGLDFESEATDRGDQLELLTEALQAVAFCAARGSLSELQLCFEYLPAFRFSSATAAALAGLRKFSLTVQGGGIPDEQDLFDGLLAVVGPLHIMTGLRELHLKGCPLHLKPRLRLPPGLTQLHLGSDVERTFDRLPKQLSSLAALRHLSIHALWAPAEQYSVLAPLTGLQRLELEYCEHLPAVEVLQELSSLEALSLDHRQQPGSVVTLNAALEAVGHQLTKLQLQPRGMPQWPQALAACTELRHLALDGRMEQPALPQGGWLAGLHRLVVPQQTAAASLAAPQVVPRLEVLGLTDMKEDQQAGQALLSFAAEHPRLQRLVLDEGKDPAVELQQAVAQAQQRKPSLDVVWCPSQSWVTSVALKGDPELTRMREVLAPWRDIN